MEQDPHTTKKQCQGDTALQEQLMQLRQWLANYEELDCEMDDEAYIARGNGFCDTKFSEAFLQSQMADLRRRIEEIEKLLQ